MGFVLDAIIREDIFIGPETVSVDFLTDSFDISKAESDFSVQLTYDNGSAVNVNLYLEVSSDNVNFSEITGSGQNISDASGSHIWDIQGSGAVFARVKIEVIAGSIDLQKIEYTGKRRH